MSGARVSAAVAGSALLLGACGQISGVRCESKGRILSDAELVNSGVDNFIGIMKWHAEPDGIMAASAIETLRREIIAKHRPGRFLLEHPGCCTLSMTGPDGSSISPAAAARQPGPYRWVHIAIPLGTDPRDPSSKTERRLTSLVLINSCGTSVGTDG